MLIYSVIKINDKPNFDYILDGTEFKILNRLRMEIILLHISNALDFMEF